MKRLDGRKSRNVDLYEEVHASFLAAGFNRTVEQLKNRFKALKTDYHKAKSHNNLSGNDPTNFPFFEAMDEVLGDRPLAQSGEYGVDFTFDEEEEEEEEEDVGGAEENLDVLGECQYCNIRYCHK